MTTKFFVFNNVTFEIKKTYMTEFMIKNEFFKKIYNEMLHKVPALNKINYLKIIFKKRKINFSSIYYKPYGEVNNSDLERGKNLIKIYLASFNLCDLEDKVKSTIIHESTHVTQFYQDHSIKAKQKALRKIKYLQKKSQDNKNIYDFHKELIAFELMVIAEGVACISQLDRKPTSKEFLKIHYDAESRAKHFTKIFNYVINKYEEGSKKGFNNIAKKEIANIINSYQSGSIEHPKFFIYNIGKEVISQLIYQENISYQAIFNTPQKKLLDIYARSCIRNEKTPVISYNENSILKLKTYYERLRKLKKIN